MAWLGAAAAAAQPPALHDCRLTTPGGERSASARCGHLDVPESTGGPEITLNLALVPARAAEAAPDPVVFLAGGPGQAATQAYPALAPAFSALRDTRPVLLVDQRGTGGSNPLACPQVEASGLTGAGDPAAQARACLDALAADPRFYTTEAAVRDLEAVRAAFGYPRLNLVAVSYGTRVALHYLRRYPDRVRSLVLDGVVPPELALGAEHARNLDTSLEHIFSACLSAPECAARFPDPGADLARLRRRLAAAPLQLSLPDPATGVLEEVSLDTDLLGLTVRLMSYEPETVALLPLLLQAAGGGRIDPLAAQAKLLIGEISRSIAAGLELSVMCTEDAPLFGPAATDEPRLLRVARQECAVWPRGEMSPDFHEPVESGVPALLLSGAWDPVTPPRYGEAVASHLHHSRHLVAAGQGHNLIPRGCVADMVAEFIGAGSAEHLDPACVDQLGPPAFFTRFTGPQP